ADWNGFPARAIAGRRTHPNAAPHQSERGAATNPWHSQVTERMAPMARTTRKSTTLLTTIAVASLLLSGCAATSGEPAQSPAAPSHTMPDGTVMDGAEHDAHGED